MVRAYRYSILPDTRKRTLAISNGGIVSLAKRTPRKVDPQMMYTAANALMSLMGEGLVVCIGFKTNCARQGWLPVDGMSAIVLRPEVCPSAGKFNPRVRMPFQYVHDFKSGFGEQMGNPVGFKETEINVYRMVQEVVQVVDVLTDVK